MPSFQDTVLDSVRMGGRDTDALKKTGFINLDAITPPPPPPTEPKYEMWTEDHGVQSRIRRENRANKPKATPVAEVEDFDVERHLANPDAGAPKKKWKFW